MSDDGFDVERYLKQNERGFQKKDKLILSPPESFTKYHPSKDKVKISTNNHFNPDSIGLKIYKAFRKSKENGENFAYSFFPCQIKEPIVAFLVGATFFIMRLSVITLIWGIQLIINSMIK